MKLFIPELGTRVVLQLDWHLTIHDESRNQSVYDALAEAAGVEPTMAGTSRWRAWNGPDMALILPAGTVLTLDRIYIRKGQEDFSSLTFTIENTTHPLLEGLFLLPNWDGTKFTRRKRRFWAKLADVNRMEIEDVD